MIDECNTMEELRERLRVLEQRIHELEAEPRNQVTVPFRVVDALGRIVLEVTADESGPRLRLLNQGGEVISQLCAMPEGGAVMVHNQEGESIAVLGTLREGGFLDVKTEEGEHAAVLAAKDGAGHIYALDQGEVTFNSDEVEGS